MAQDGTTSTFYCVDHKHSVSVDENGNWRLFRELQIVDADESAGAVSASERLDYYARKRKGYRLLRENGHTPLPLSQDPPQPHCQ